MEHKSPISFPDNRQSGETTLRQAQLVMLRMLKVVDYLCRKHDIPYWICSGTLLGAVRHKGFIPWDDDLDVAMLREDYERFLLIAKHELPNDMFLQTKENEPAYDGLVIPCKIRDTKSLIIASYLERKNYHKGIFIDIFPFDRYHRNGLNRLKEVVLKKYNNFICKCYNAEIGKDHSLFKRAISWLQPCFKVLLASYQNATKPIVNKNKLLPNSVCFVGHGFDTPWMRNFKMEDIFPLQELIFENYPIFAPHNTDSYLKHLYGEEYMTPPPENQRIQNHSTEIMPIL